MIFSIKWDRLPLSGISINPHMPILGKVGSQVPLRQLNLGVHRSMAFGRKALRCDATLVSPCREGGVGAADRAWHWCVSNNVSSPPAWSAAAWRLVGGRSRLARRPPKVRRAPRTSAPTELKSKSTPSQPHQPAAKRLETLCREGT